MPPHKFLTDGALCVDPRPDMDPALAGHLKTLQGKLRDIVSEVATFADATTTADEEVSPRPKVDDAWRAVLACTKNATEWFAKERARILASTTSADDKTESSSGLDETYFREIVLEAKEKVERALATLHENRPERDVH